MPFYTTPKVVKETFANLLIPKTEEIKNVASFPFSQNLGMPIPSVEPSRAVPGITVLHTLMLPPSSDSSRSAINKGAKAYYNYVTQGFTSTQSSYESADLMVYQYAVSYLYMYLAELKRVYGVIRKYSPYNKYLARTLVEALGFDYSSLVKNLANIRAEFNVRVDQLNKALYIMPDFQALQVWINFTSKVFADSNVEKFQMYAFRPKVYGEWSADGGSHLKAFRPNERRNYDTMFSNFDYLYEVMINDSDVNNISAAILRVYKPEGVVQISDLAEDYEVSIEYSGGHLKTINNAIAVGEVNFTDGDPENNTLKILYQSNNNLFAFTSTTITGDIGTVYGEVAHAMSSDLSGPHLVNFPYEDPSPEEVLEAIYLQPTARVATTDRINIYHAGMVVEKFEVVFNATDRINGSDDHIEFMSYTTSNSGLNNTLAFKGRIAYIDMLSMFSNFDWAPLLRLPAENPTAGTFDNRKARNIFGDLCNYTFINAENVSGAHEKIAYYGTMTEKNTESVTR